jgi:uncharacterized protein (DUF2147 family)
VLVATHRLAQADTPSRTGESVLLGEWWTENNEGIVKFAKYPDGTYRGTTTCCKPKRYTDESPETDIHNPNPKLRTRSPIGIVIIWKLVYEDGEYTGGYVYNPRDGKTYHIQVKVIDQNTIKIRGYLGLPVFGQSQVWKRVRPLASSASPVPPAFVRSSTA